MSLARHLVGDEAKVQEMVKGIIKAKNEKNSELWVKFTYFANDEEKIKAKNMLQKQYEKMKEAGSFEGQLSPLIKDVKFLKTEFKGEFAYCKFSCMISMYSSSTNAYSYQEKEYTLVGRKVGEEWLYDYNKSKENKSWMGFLW
ncbi:MAG: hypothetical protein Kow0029_09640 [Candidatus Rifleibacteriota bacterium]